MKLIKNKGWNTIGVINNNLDYFTYLDRIHFFNKEGIILTIVSHNFDVNNWVSHACYPYHFIDIDIDCVIKRKENFTIKTAYVIKQKDSIYDHYDLYIPEEAVKFNSPIYEKQDDGKLIVESRTSTIYPALTVRINHYTINVLNRIQLEFSDTAEHLRLYEDELENVQVGINKLQSLYELFIDERERLKNASIEELLKIE